MRFPVVEHFTSINGEGLHVGQLATFVRFKGCNLACAYCDTQWANASDCPAELLSAEEIRDLVRAAGARRVTLTGGEPLLQPDIASLVNLLLADAERCVEVETNGACAIDELHRSCDDRARLTLTLDCKLPASGMSAQMRAENYEFLQPHDVVKFVIGAEEDFPALHSALREHQLLQRCRVYLSPVFGQMQPARIVEFMRAEGLDGASLQLQLHKLIWPEAERGV